MNSSHPDNRPNQAEQDPAASAFAQLIDEYMEHHNIYPPGFVPNPVQSMIGSAIMGRDPHNPQDGKQPYEIQLSKAIIDPGKMAEYPAGKTTRKAVVIWHDEQAVRQSRFPTQLYAEPGDFYDMGDDGPIEHRREHFATYREDTESDTAPPRIVSDPAEIAQLAEWLAGMKPKALE